MNGGHPTWSGTAFDIAIKDHTTGERRELTASGKDEADALAKVLRRRMFAEWLTEGGSLAHTFSFWVTRRLD